MLEPSRQLRPRLLDRLRALLLHTTCTPLCLSLEGTVCPVIARDSLAQHGFGRRLPARRGPFVCVFLVGRLVGRVHFLLSSNVDAISRSVHLAGRCRALGRPLCSLRGPVRCNAAIPAHSARATRGNDARRLARTRLPDFRRGLRHVRGRRSRGAMCCDGSLRARFASDASCQHTVGGIAQRAEHGRHGASFPGVFAVARNHHALRAPPGTPRGVLNQAEDGVWAVSQHASS
mmetsp:Transcript_22674/g.43337  ORF Transcript_22674/g.43337 Transcript_22674/m.43337 type:complete len:232 (-) Transcript_22674:1376-2071(-)